MGNLLYLIAMILVIGWAIGYFAYGAGGIIHLLLFIAVVMVFLSSSVARLRICFPCSTFVALADNSIWIVCCAGSPRWSVFSLMLRDWANTMQGDKYRMWPPHWGLIGQ